MEQREKGKNGCSGSGVPRSASLKCRGFRSGPVPQIWLLSKLLPSLPWGCALKITHPWLCSCSPPPPPLQDTGKGVSSLSGDLN